MASSAIRIPRVFADFIFRPRSFQQAASRKELIQTTIIQFQDMVG